MLERLRTSSSPSSDPDLHIKMLFGTFVSRCHKDDEEIHYLPNLMFM